eukprot:UN04045
MVGQFPTSIHIFTFFIIITTITFPYFIITSHNHIFTFFIIITTKNSFQTFPYFIKHFP